MSNRKCIELGVEALEDWFQSSFLSQGTYHVPLFHCRHSLFLTVPLPTLDSKVTNILIPLQTSPST